MTEPSSFPYLNNLHPSRLFASVPELTVSNDRPSTKPPLLDSTSLKILSWNVARTNLRRSWTDDYQTIVDQHQPDLIFLQEVRLDADNQALSTLEHLGWHFAPNFFDQVSRNYSGLLTAAHANPADSQAMLTQDLEPVANTPKISLFNRYELRHSDNSLLAVNIHAINFVTLSKFKAQLEMIAARLAHHAGPILFAGDFNTWNGFRWQALQRMTERLNLTAVTFDLEQRKYLKRFLLSPPLDHIFYRGFTQKPSSARVIDTLTSSDHNPLLVELVGRKGNR